MSRKPNIKWRKSDAEKLNKEIKRFNAKINRTLKAHPELAPYLPAKINKLDKQDLVEKLKASPRSELNKEIKSLDRFSRRGAEQTITSKTGNTVTKWERKEIGLQVAQLNRERTRQRKEAEAMEVTTRGEKTGFKRGEMYSERLNELKPKKFDFDKIKGGVEWEKFKASISKQTSPEYYDKRMEEYKANYIQGLRNAFGDYANDIIETIEGLPAETVVKKYYSEQESTIDFFYEKQDMEIKLEMLRGIWSDLDEVKKDNAFNG